MVCTQAGAVALMHCTLVRMSASHLAMLTTSSCRCLRAKMMSRNSARVTWLGQHHLWPVAVVAFELSCPSPCRHIHCVTGVQTLGWCRHRQEIHKQLEAGGCQPFLFWG